MKIHTNEVIRSKRRADIFGSEERRFEGRAPPIARQNKKCFAKMKRQRKMKKTKELAASAKEKMKKTKELAASTKEK
jgi:hypothetical protein